MMEKTLEVKRYTGYLHATLIILPFQANCNGTFCERARPRASQEQMDRQALLRQ